MSKIFNWKDFCSRSNHIAVHCTTPEDSEEFCKLMDEHGLRLSSGRSYLDGNLWYKYKEKMCYGNHGTYGHKEAFIENSYIILDWVEYSDRVESVEEFLKRKGKV